MKRVLLAGAAIATVLAVPAFGQPIPQPRTASRPPTFEQQMQQSNRQQAEQESRDNAQLQRDLSRMTPEAREQYMQFGRERVAELTSRHDFGSTGRVLVRDIERGFENLQQPVFGTGAFDPATAGSLTDRQFGESGAHGVVNGGAAQVQIGRDAVRTLRPLITDMVQTGAQIAAERERLIVQSNPNMSQAQRDILRYETQRVSHAAQTIDQRLDESDFRSRGAEQRLRESEGRIAAEMERMAQEQGHDITQWNLPTSPNGTPVPPRSPGRTFPVPQSTTPAAALPAAGPTPSSTSTASHSGSSSGQHGTVPGQNGDPYAGLRVPHPAQGGTGASTPQSPAGAQAGANQQAQAERNQSRTDRARQQAMDQARRDNEEIDAHSGAMHSASNATLSILAAEAEAEAEYNDMLDALRRSARPGNVGGAGSSGGEGYAEGGGSYDDQMAGGDGLPDGIPSIVEWMRPDYAEAAEDGSFGPFDAFDEMAAATEGMSDADFYDAWRSFELGGTITVAELVPIYDGYDIDNAPLGSSGRSLSSAGTSLSSAGNSLSSAGMSLSSAGSITPSSAPTGMRVDWDGYNLSADPFRVSNGGRPEPGSYGDMLAQLNGPRPSYLNTDPWADHGLAASNRDLAEAMYGPLWSNRPYRIQADPYGNYGRAMSNIEAASLYDTDFDTLLRSFGSDFAWLRDLTANGRGGLDRLLAQPFNVLLTWGANAYDLDLHMTGPLAASTDRFHIYYAAQGTLTAQPFAQLIQDCICNSGSEVILTSALNRNGGVYRVSVFNYGDQAAASTNLANASQATLQIVRGGTAVSQGNGTTIVGGHTLLTATAPQGQAGNTWVAAEINPNNGRISAPGVIVQSGSSDIVH